MSCRRQWSRDEPPKLSLLAQFDDMVRCTDQLTRGIEDEFITFLKNQIENKSNDDDLVDEIEKLKQDLKKVEQEKNALKARYLHAKLIAEEQMKKREIVDKEKKSLENQIQLIKEVLLNDQTNLNDQTRQKLAFLNRQEVLKQTSPKQFLMTIEESMGSLLSSSDISFDKTDDGLEEDLLYPNISPKRRSNSKRGRSDLDKSISKKAKFQDEESSSDDRDQNGNAEFQYASVGPLTRSKRSFRELKEKSPPTPPVPPKRMPFYVPDDVFETGFTDDAPIDLPPPTKNTPLRRLSSTGHMNRAHQFCTKTLIRQEICSSCGTSIKFFSQALKCQECRAICHPECKSRVPLPCMPTVHTPNTRAVLGNLADFATTTPPMIPPLIVHCVREIEARGLSEIGLYRVPGSEREVRELKEKFLRGKCVPCLSKVDIHAVCGTIKEFLRSLSEPLISRALWHDFVLASEVTSESAMKQAVARLPQPNRDTLAFLILHLTSVSLSPDCKMPMDNLEKVFGPTIVGYSVGEQQEVDLLKETGLQIGVMHMLLNAPVEYWAAFVCIEKDKKGPVLTEARKETLLTSATHGSTATLGTRSTRGVTVEKVPLPPRNAKTMGAYSKRTPLGSSSVKAKRRYFNSPGLK